MIRRIIQWLNNSGPIKDIPHHGRWLGVQVVKIAPEDTEGRFDPMFR